MKHVITITPLMFKEADYLTDCALTKALTKALTIMFPQAVKIIVSNDAFTIIFSQYGVRRGPIYRKFISCQIESHDQFDSLEDLLYENHYSDNPKTVTFNFLTA